MKLLVTTDFSANSKGAIRFAQTLAKQSKKVEVVFYHALHFLKPNNWNEDFYSKYKKEEIERLTDELKKFVVSVIGKDKEKFASINYVIDTAISIEKDIVNYAEKNKFDFICIATQGAGMLRKIMGTHTSFVVNNAKIPVMVIPSHYRTKTLKKATYLSDFENLKKELKKIESVTNEVKFNLEVLHYSSKDTNTKKFEQNTALFDTDEFKKIKLNITKSNHDLSLIEKVAKHVSKSKPELLIMFTKSERGFFESIFLPSKSAELTFSTKVPVLIFSK